MCDDKECKLADLKPGTMVWVITKKGDKDTVIAVKATTKEIKKDDKKDKPKKDK